MMKRAFSAFAAALFLTLCGISASVSAEEYREAYTILLLGDTHFDDRRFHIAPLEGWRLKGHERCLKMWETRSPELLTVAGKRAAAEHVVLAVQLGDLDNGECDTPELLNKLFLAGFSAIEKYFPGIPLLAVKGNHDIRTTKSFRNNAPVDDALRSIISRTPGCEYWGNGCYSFRIGADLYMAADGFIPAGKIEEFVKTTLEKNPDVRYVFFLSHLPLIPASVKYPFWLLPGHVKVMEMLEKRNTLIVAGHTHVASWAVRRTSGGELPQLVVTSMGSEWCPGKPVPAKFADWETFSRTSRGRAVAGNRYNSPEMWETLEKRGVYTFRELSRSSGFAVLDVNAERVEARYYTDGSGKPAAVLKLLKGKGAD
ncbi:MAG: metallophosphoesterase [Lentisphaeria bacterium]|nr:metallophosphoesterase [Lentisphaeria bacterium]